MENMDDLLRAAEAMRPMRNEPAQEGGDDGRKQLRLGFSVRSIGVDDEDEGICVLSLMHDGDDDGMEEIPLAMFFSDREARLFSAALDVIANSKVASIEVGGSGYER